MTRPPPIDFTNTKPSTEEVGTTGGPHGDPPGLPSYAVIDTETSGLTNNKLPADHPDQPRLAHIAMVFLNHNLGFEGQDDLYAKPDGWQMSDEAYAVNGLTTRFLNDFGKPIGEVLDAYENQILSGRIVVAYNAQFDIKIMRGELRRAGRPDLFEITRNICLMRVYKAWRQIYKGYKLIDACSYLGIPYERLHRAPADALAAVEVFRAMRARGAPIPEPAVYTSKDHDGIVARGVS